MLQDMRDRMSGPIVWGIIGFLCLLFAIWGIGADSFFGGGGNPTLVKVGGVKITQSAYQNAYDRSYQQLIQMMGDSFSPAKIDQVKFRNEVLDDMIARSVLDQYAAKIGYSTGDEAVYDYLSRIPEFQTDGHFSAQAYREALARSGTTTEQFESQVRDALRVDALRETVLQTAFVVPRQAQRAWALSHETRDVDEIVFDPADYASSVKIDDGRVKQYYQDNKSKFIAPLKVKLAYIELAQDQLKPSTPPSQDVLKAIYEAQKTTRFTTKEERKASHILIRFGADADAAHKKILAIDALIKNGADFATMAKKESDDSDSRNKGGDLGWLQPGMTAPIFQQTLFGLARPGDVSTPVKTKFGWELIRLDGVRPSRLLPFDDPSVQKQLVETFDSRAAAKLYQSDSDKLADLVFENPNSLKPAAQALDLNVQTSDWITRGGGTGIAAKPGVIDAAFSPAVLKDGENSKPITVGPADQLVIRKLDEQPERQLGFDEVKDEIRKQLEQQAASDKAKAAAQAAVKAIEGGTSPGNAAKAAGVKMTPLPTVQRDSPLGRQLLAAVFDLPRPADGKPSVKLAALDKGKYGVVVLNGVHVPQGKIGDPQFDNAARRYSQALAGSEFDAYRRSMTKIIGVDREEAPKAAQPTGPDQ